MSSVGLKARAYTWTVFVCGVGVLAVLSAGSSRLTDPTILPNLDLVVWMTMVLVAAMSPIPLPRGFGNLTPTTILDFAAILLFGPAMACWIGVLSRLSANTLEHWNPLPRSIMRIGSGILAIAGAGAVYAALGGAFGGELEVDTALVLPLGAACLAYLAIKALLAGGEALLEDPHPGRAFAEFVRESTLGDLVMLPLAPLLAFTQVRIGSVGVALFLIPLVLARYMFRLWAETRSAHMDMVRSLMSAVDGTDPFTRGHSYRISKMSLRIGRQLGMPAADLEELEFAGLLHDIGRTAIRREVLLKSGRLTENEQLMLHAHPKIGHDLIAGLRLFPRAAEIVLCHHERPDGKGYPRGLTGEAIPLASRIIMVVSAFDALTSDRPYRRGLSPEESFDELLAHAGTQFAPEVVEALIHLYSNDALFDEFDDSHLDAYREGLDHSRAIDGYLRSQGGHAVPEKTGIARPPARRAQADPPLIELPDGLSEADEAGDTGVPVALAAVAPAEAPAAVQETIALRAKGDWKLVVAAQSDLGCRRRNNEDAFGVFEYDEAGRGCLLVLADGMGGAAAGEVASRMAVDTLGAAYGRAARGCSTRDALRDGITEANREIHAHAAGNREKEGMGTTCTSAAIVGLDLVLGHVGDSRAYLVRKGKVEQISQDHTLGAELSRVAGSPVGAPAGAEHVMTRALGPKAEVAVDVSEKPIALSDGAVLVLCSDGLSNLVEAQEIGEIVTDEAPEEACATLVELARGRGGPDNITVVVARVAKG